MGQGQAAPRSENEINILTLTQADLQARVQELNALSQESSTLLQNIIHCELAPIVPKAKSIFWKLQAKIRVICTPLSGDAVIERTLNLRAFCHFYTTVKDQLPSLMGSSMTSSAAVSGLVERLDSSELDVENVCIICMDAAVDETLACGHPFCHACIDNWRRDHPTCPFCRERFEKLR